MGVVEELHIAQQPLSQAIRRLEAQLGVALFERTSRCVILTETGRVFLGEARALLRRSADAIEAARRAARGEAGALAIGYGSGTPDVVMPGAVRRFRERHPGAALRLVELDAPAIEVRVATGDLDVGPPRRVAVVLLNALFHRGRF